MPRRDRRLTIEEYIGLANRLETLNLAFAIEQAYGHEVWLDWPELDALVIAGTQSGKPGWLARYRALRLRDCSEQVFATLDRHAHILLRTYLGPDAVLEPLYATTLARIGIRSWVARELEAIFGVARDRPVVGVHVRRGDYPLAADDRYDATGHKHPAVPLWWYEHTMQALSLRDPSTMFYLSCSGDDADVRGLRERFPTLEARTPDSYHGRGAGHRAQFHPVVDLFALACCATVLATPLSSFSHYAANLLGPRSICLLPATRMERSQPRVCRLDASGKRHVHWTAWCRTGEHHVALSDQLSEVPLAPAATHWLPVAAD